MAWITSRWIDHVGPGTSFLGDLTTDVLTGRISLELKEEELLGKDFGSDLGHGGGYGLVFSVKQG
jgi:hypothetical protein